MRIGARLTLWGTVITLGTCTAVCITLYVGLHFSLYAEVDSFLVGEVQEFLTILNDDEDDSLEEIERDIREELGSRLRNDLAFRLLAPDGGLVLTSDSNDSLPRPWNGAWPSETTGEAVHMETIAVAHPAMEVRVCSRRVVLPKRGEFVAQATYRLDSVAASLSRFRMVGGVAMALATVLSIVGGRLLARKSLRPIHTMTKTARRIGGEELSRRLHRAGNGDELDHLAAVLNEMLERLERQFNQIQQFTADAAHELRTPIAALRGNAELALGDQASPEDRRRVLAESIEEYDRLSKLTDELLLLARADAGSAFLHRESVSLNAIVHDVVDLFAPLAQEKGVDVQYDEGPRVDLVADGARLRQVLSNLLDNAVKYTQRPGRITVSLTEENGSIQLAVRDTGPGIPAENLPRIFDRFFRIDTARTRGAGGAGLGLAICHSIIAAHGGRIDVENAAVGTVFTVRLPKPIGSGIV